jgi:glycosidase
MKARTTRSLSRIFRLSAIVTVCLMFLGTFLWAQDPPQYGTPFSGVPDARDVNMYQVHIRPYSAAGNLAGVTARLDAIKALGINVVYLMPIYPVGQDSRSSISPYCIRDFKAVGAEYGSLADLRTLVDGAHARGMAVILDWVVNQTSWDHAWITQHPDYYVRDGNGVIQPLNPFPDVAALNFASAAMRTEMINAMRYWVFAANIDGFRCDYANNPPLDFWTQAINNLRGITTHKLLMFAEGDRLENFQVGFDLNFGDKWYYDAIRKISQEGLTVAQIQTTTNTEYTYATGSQQVVRYTANHDTESSVMPLTVFQNHAGVVANFLVSAYMRGVPFLTSGQETDFNQVIPWPWNSVKINWNTNPSAAADFTKVLNFRTSSNAIRRGTMTNYSNANVCAFTKISGTDKVVVMTNLRNAASTFVIPSAMAGAYKDAYTGVNVTLTSGATQTLAAYQYIVLTNTACTPTAITPYISINGGAFTQTATATLTAGGSVTFGPQPLTGGSWNWTGPNGYTAAVREITFTNVQTSQSGNYVATYTNSAGCASSQTFTLTVNPPPSNLPSPWLTADVGAVGAAGSASHSNGTYTINASGADVFDFADEFRYIYQPFSGNVTVTVRVGSLTNTNAWAKAGVMIRESLTNNASNAAMVLTPSNGFNFQYRNGTGAGSTAGGNAAGTIPNWVRITRSGNTLTGFRSTDGNTWIQTGTVTITLPSSVYIGFFATSHNDGVLTTATFTNVAVSGGANNPPVANAGADKSLAAGTTSTTLPGSGSDPDGNPIAYSWTQVSGPAATITNGNTATATVSGLANGNTYVFQLTVSDGSLSASDQVQVSVASGGATYYTIRNRWKGTYLYDAGANVGYGTTVANNNYKWEKVPVDATYFYLKNLGTGEYMHIENQTGSVQCGPITMAWWSAQWSQESVDATYVRFRNRWQTASIVHVENQTGFAQYSGGQDGWWSAHWQLSTIAARVRTGETAFDEEDAEGERLVEIYPNPARGNLLSIFVGPMRESEVADLTVQDVNGKIALRTQIHGSGSITHDLIPGLYFVRVRGKKIDTIKKIMIE